MRHGKDLYVVLGCYGRRTDDFVSCPSVKNFILRVDVTLEHYDEIMDYFEGCRLFDKPMFDFNAVRNFLQSMQNRFDQIAKPLWSKKNIDLYQNFVITHRACGVYIWLDLLDKTDLNHANKEQERISIKSTDLDFEEPRKNHPRNQLRLIRTKP